MKRKLFIFLCAAYITFAMSSFTAYADNPASTAETQTVATSYERNNDDGFAETFAEADAKGISYGKPLTEKSRIELYNEGFQFYDGINYLMPKTRATITGVLGYVNGSGSYNVRNTSGGTGTILGTVKQKDIVKVNSISGDFANVTFVKADGTELTGYMLNYAIYTPAYNWVSPTGTVGTVTQHYGDYDTNSSGHTGVDIGGVSTTTSVKAVNNGTATFKIATINVNNEMLYAEYGRYVFLDTTAGSASKRVVYGHLSSLSGYSTPNYNSEGYPALSHETLNYQILDTKNVSKGAVLGKTGASGTATGNHLHLEVRQGVSVTREDPFLYVVFPQITCA